MFHHGFQIQLLAWFFPPVSSKIEYGLAVSAREVYSFFWLNISSQQQRSNSEGKWVILVWDFCCKSLWVLSFRGIWRILGLWMAKAIKSCVNSLMGHRRRTWKMRVLRGMQAVEVKVMRNQWEIGSMKKLSHWSCGGLNELGLHMLMYVNTWSTNNGIE